MENIENAICIDVFIKHEYDMNIGYVLRYDRYKS